MSRRRRFRPSEAAPNPKRSLPFLAMVVVALAALIAYKATVGDQTAGLFEGLVQDPSMKLPDGAMEDGEPRGVDAGSP